VSNPSVNSLFHWPRASVSPFLRNPRNCNHLVAPIGLLPDDYELFQLVIYQWPRILSQFLRAKTQTPDQNSMELIEIMNHIKTRPKPKLKPRLDLTFPNQDWHSIKHMMNMQPTCHECISEHKDLKTYLRLKKKDPWLITTALITPIRSCIH